MARVTAGQLSLHAMAASVVCGKVGQHITAEHVAVHFGRQSYRALLLQKSASHGGKCL